MNQNIPSNDVVQQAHNMLDHANVLNEYDAADEQQRLLKRLRYLLDAVELTAWQLPGIIEQLEQLAQENPFNEPQNNHSRE
jgi:hypothetical protein